MTKMDFGRVAVLYGGSSSEREISIKSGTNVFQALQAAGINVVAIDAGRDLVEQLKALKIDRVFNVLHGPGGEDGDIPGLLNTLNLPYTGSNVLASSLAMDKVRSKLIWQTLGLPVLPFATVDKAHALKCANVLGYPLCIKPVYQGSSLGVHKVNRPEELEEAIQKSRVYGALMMEPWINGIECTVTVLNGQTLPIIVIRAKEAFYDFQAKYISDFTEYECPANLTEALTKEIQELALAAFNALGCQGWGRVDFMLDHTKRPWLLEVNTVPGMTNHSLVPMAAKANGITFQELCVKILEQTLAPRESSIVYMNSIENETPKRNQTTA